MDLAVDLLSSEARTLPTTVTPSGPISDPQISPIQASSQRRTSTSAVSELLEPSTEPWTPVTSTPRVDSRFLPVQNSRISDDGSVVPALLKEVQDLRQTLSTMNEKLDACNRRTASLEIQLKKLIANNDMLIDITWKFANKTGVINQMLSGSDTERTESAPTGIPEEFQLEDSYLRRTLRE